MRLGQPTLSTFLASPIAQEEQNAHMISIARKIQGDILLSQKAFKRAMRAYAEGVIGLIDNDLSTFAISTSQRATYDMWRRVLGAASAASLSENPIAAAALRTGVSLLKMLCCLGAPLDTPAFRHMNEQNEDVMELLADARSELNGLDASLATLDAGRLEDGLAGLAATAAIGKSCFVCGRRPGTPYLPKLKVCSGCRGPRYCGEACQLYAWAEHSSVCPEPTS
jgi:hypothetical protein